MYGQGGGYGGWNPWGGGAGSGSGNPHGQAQQHGMNPMQQFQNQQQQQQQQQQPGMMGYGQGGMMGMPGYNLGMGGANNNMMGMTGYPGTGGMTPANNMMGLAANNNAAGMMGMTGATNAHQLNMSGTPGHTNMLGTGMGMNSHSFGNNQYGNQLNPYAQQQQQPQNVGQSLFPSTASYGRPQPPLPPGPPPKDQPARDLAKQPLFNNIVPQSSEAQTPVLPPPLPKEAVGVKPNNNPPLPPPPDSRNTQHKIPEHVLNLLKSAEAARILETAENCPQMTPLMKLNVSQDLFGTPSNLGKKTGIPGLDFEFADGNPETDSKDETDHRPERVERIDFDTFGNRKLDQKPPSTSEWNQFNRKNQSWRGDNRSNEVEQPTKPQEQPQSEIKWELRSEINTTNPPSTSDLHTKVIPNNESSLPPVKPAETHIKTNEQVPNKNGGPAASSVPVVEQHSLNSPSNKPMSSAVSDTESVESSSGTGVAATIPLGSADGKPVAYDRKTLRTFDKKFREWEMQFENWKKANDHHPDRDAYRKYMDQWNLWRQQLIEQRRFILDSMNKARMEGTEMALQKNIAQLDKQTAVAKPKPTNESNIEERGQFAAKPEESPVARGQPTRPPLISNKPNQTVPSPIVPKQSQTPSSNIIRQEEQNKTVARNSNFGNPLEKVSSESEVRKTQAPPPPPLMSLMSVSVDPPVIKNSTDNASTLSNTRSDRDKPVERIPRDKDRPDIQSSKLDQSFGNSEQQRRIGGEDRVCRDPQGEQQKQTDRNIRNPWAQQQQQQQQPNKPDKNPFEVAQNQQNPFIQQASSQNPFAWNQPAEDNLPKLSDFLQEDTFSMPSQATRAAIAQNRRMATSSMNRFTEDMPDRVRREPGMSRNTIDRLEGVTFEQNPRGMPLLTATKPQPIQSEEDTTNDLSQWFTRDRRGAFEEDNNPPDETRDEYDDAPAVIDYGHGSTKTNEEEEEAEEYDIPRGERPVIRRQPDEYPSYEDERIEEDEPQDVVTIDYGHGTVPPPHMGPSQTSHHHGYPPEDDYYQNEEYYGEYENYQGYPPVMMNHRGRGVLRGRGGRGLMGMHPSYRAPMPGYVEHPAMRPRGMDPNLRSINKPFPNRGIGRGGPTRFPVSDMAVPVGYIERSLHPQTKQRPRDIELETERVESPEIICLSPPRERVAPPREIIEERRRIVPRDSGSGGRESSRDRSRRSDRSRSRSRDRDEPSYRSKRDTSRDSDERRRSDRRNRHDESPPVRRDRDRDTKDRYGRARRSSRSRSRSPAFERVAIYRNAPGATSGSPGSNNKGLDSSVNPPPPRYQTVLIEDILNQPGRTKRASQIVIILRGLPGSGKTHVAKLIKDREIEMGGSAPRIISLDDYFMAETEKLVKDPITNSEVKQTVMEYEYEPDLEPKYRNDLVKTFKKTVENQYFPCIIVDCVNDQVKHFEHMVAYATQKRFQVYIAEMEESVENCVKRNIHHRTKDQIQKIHRNWERTPSFCVKLDIRTLLQDEAIQDVEMEDVSNSDTEIEEVEAKKKDAPKLDENWEEDEPSTDEAFLVQSKWDKLEPSEEKLNQLDGLARKRTTGDDDKVDPLGVSIDSWLQSHLPEDYSSRQQTRPGQKRVRWADIEERRAQERMRDVGFVVGHTDWNRMTDPSFGSGALTKTKYI